MTPDYMSEALALARQGVALASPNPMVGAVIVRDDEVVGRGFHTWAGLKHAEILALEEAGERARGATIYVTLEPCSHTGRTPPCVDALIAAGIAKVVVASEDPNPLVAGEGLRRLRASGIAVELSPEHRAAAEKLNEAFLHFMRTGRPLVTLKTALTLDGKIAAPDDNTRLDHQRTRPRPRAGSAPRHRRHPHRHRHRARRQFSAQRPQRTSARPSAPAHRSRFHPAHFASPRTWCKARMTIC